MLYIFHLRKANQQEHFVDFCGCGHDVRTLSTKMLQSSSEAGRHGPMQKTSTNTVDSRKTLGRAKGLPADFRILLQMELARRCQSNNKYSLRAFAKFLNMESSHLSKILRGERPVNTKLISSLGERLGLAPADIQTYVTTNKLKKYCLVAAPPQDYVQISQDVFEALEDWRHYAILELMKFPNFQTDFKWLAKMLQVTVSEARIYVERLQRVGLIEVKTDGIWHDTSKGFSTHILSDTETSYAHKRSQKQLLKLAIESLDKTPIHRRDQSSVMMATSLNKIAEAKKRIQIFRRELCRFLEDTDEKDCIFQLCVSLFPLTEANIDKKET